MQDDQLGCVVQEAAPAMQERARCVCGHLRGYHAWDWGKCLVSGCDCDVFKKVSDIQQEKR